MKLKSPFRLLSRKERAIHAISWTIGLTLVNIPGWDVTIGNFHSNDYSLLIPSIYGTFFNAFLFYENSRMVVDLLEIDSKLFIRKSIILLLAISLPEAMMDMAYYSFFYHQLPTIIVSETLWGQLLMNGIFFYLPSLVFGFTKAWKKRPGSNSDSRITIRDGGEMIYLQISELTHIESDGNYCIYYAAKKHLVRQSLVQAKAMLPERFIRCHKSFIVNTELIEKKTYHDLSIGQHTIPIGRKYRADLNAYLTKS